ncbi:MAG: fumarylacetoacetate hydrolase family protein [Bacillota bacterium]
MGIVRFEKDDGAVALGIAEEEKIVSLEGVCSSFSGLFQLNDQKTALQEALQKGRRYARTAVCLKAPLDRNAAIFAVAANYVQHAAEMGVTVPEHPLIFNKLYQSMIGPDEEIVFPPYSRQMDYEGELAVIIGKGGFAIAEEEAMAHVGGYTCFNDITARDRQWTMLGEHRIIDWFSSKMMERSTPLGPWIVLQEEIPNPHDLRLQTRINGDTVQDESTALMVFKIPVLIAYISSRVFLHPGDVIATGTPFGVGGYDKKIILQPGDKIEVEIQKIGILTNRCRAQI